MLSHCRGCLKKGITTCIRLINVEIYSCYFIQIEFYFYLCKTQTHTHIEIYTNIYHTLTIYCKVENILQHYLAIPFINYASFQCTRYYCSLVFKPKLHFCKLGIATSFSICTVCFPWVSLNYSYENELKNQIALLNTIHYTFILFQKPYF